MTSRPPTRLQAQARPQAGEESTTGQPHGAVAGLRHALTRPLPAPARPPTGEESVTGRALTGLQAQARPQAGEEGVTGQLRGALTGLARARPLAGEPA